MITNKHETMKNKKPIHIIVVGTRGIPCIAGGVETICEELYPRIVNLGCAITVIRRSSYVDEKNKIIIYKGVKLIDIFSTKLKSLEAIIHTLISVVYARWEGCNILHIHTIGPSLLTPLAKIMGLKVVVTSQGPDYDRQKWGWFAKFILKFAERCGVKYADKYIVISNVVKNIIEQNYKRFDCIVIHNGVNIPTPSHETEYITSLGLIKNKYIVGVARFVEEKGFHDLIEAYSKIFTKDDKLVLVGDATHETKYSKYLIKYAKDTGVILTGFIKGDKLNQIYSHAKLFVLPSYHEGLPLALLEAMSFNLDVLVSNIPAHLEVDLGQDCYFETGEVEDLAKKIELKLSHPTKVNYLDIIRDKYNWEKIANETVKVYRALVQ
jgi:glycosyltransferase involved in cell wall biosynthesis